MTNPSNRPRKSPKQDRSSDLVSAVYEACVRIFKSSKKIPFSTRSVAELAGISVGSFYQYFPNKEALIGVLIEREAKKHVQQLEEKYNSAIGSDFETIVHSLVSEILSLVENDKLFLRGILKSIFFVDRLNSVIDTRESAVQFISKVLIENQRADIATAHAKAYTIVATIGGIIETLIFRTDERISLEQLIEETSLLIAKYCS